MIPINKDSTDPFYRYKMPSLCVTREGKQGNPRTIISNFITVANCLKRQPTLIKQYFTYQLSVQMKLGEKLVLNGKISSDILQQTLYNFIDLLVICRHCENPETSIIFFSGPSEYDSNEEQSASSDDSHEEKLGLQCYACGEKSVIKSAHKIIEYIFKNTESVEFTCYEEATSENAQAVELSKDVQKINISTDVTDEEKFLQNFKELGEQYLQKVLNRIFKDGKYEKLALFKPILQDNKLDSSELEVRKDTFFSLIEQIIVKKNLFTDIEDISSCLLTYLKPSDFHYFRTKSKVIQKKESVKIRNMLGNFVEFKD